MRLCIGIPRDKQQAVFEPFVQADGSANRKYGGTGLGLAIVSTIISDHNGYIRVRDNSPHGTRFIVELPATNSGMME